MPDSSLKSHQTGHTSSQNDQEDSAVERRSLRDYYIIIRERIWIALPLALIVALSVGYYQAQETPMYSSSATLQFERPSKVVSTDGVVDPSVKSDADLNTYIQILNSGRLRSKVIDSLTPDEIKILQRPYLKDLKPGATPPGPGGLLGSISVEPIRGSYLLRISVSNRDPEGAALVANRYVSQFMYYVVQNVGGKSEFAVQYLKDRSEELRKDAEIAEQKLQDYKQKQNLISLDNSLNIINDRVKAINGAKTSAHLEYLSLQGYLDQVQAFKKDGKNLLEIAYIFGYGTIPNLRSQLDGLVRDQAILGERYLDRHPKMVDLANSIVALRQQLDKSIELAVTDLQTRLDKQRETESTLTREFADSEKDALRLGSLGVEFKSLEDQALVAKNNYIQIMDRRTQTQTSKNLEDVSSKPLDSASASGSPYAPNISKIIRSAVGLGFLVFFGIAIGLSFIDDRIKSSWDVETFIGTHLLGIVPDLADVPAEDRGLLALSNQNAPGAEAFLSVYSSIKIQSKLDFPKTLLVTSTIPAEGKTLISSNLAASFARHGKNVLLVDCVFPPPMLHRHFKLQNDAGIITWYEAAGAVQDDPLTDPTLGITKLADHLWLLRSGGRSKSPTELLENPIFGQLLENLKRRFDLLVIDSPPLGAVTDALLIAERTDEVVYVCRFNRAYRKHIKMYIKSLRQGKNEILGIVLNGLSHRRIEYYSNYRYYRSYKKYYGSQT